ncbi:30S ribosomal protein S18 [Mycoplasma flocculare]|uniref:Small ribosomal subunit protein bS18 n=2 Tax=Mesomycoplasma flocculare TaxID=2128 RepID=A0A0A8E711_MESFC|nr:30S ribosomal protein S18 [Mesomycoplasma flocculare]MXR39417.1 30S ribosomal protein S18 [Mycoplasma sp. MF12]AJC49798.1 30S ribosomal protein S18 [Mesomycoplasma flocculare ATCC 27399]MXR05830.1 30S ribosomal protein S18 [Mesomycoplasma flocculare]MXR12483.1 30S ribosomal protein S18 [Mesomycoplasma flocculare]MXR13783.1 30S ribosomal protein S18 [Mesomycoplasma flocculare]
MNKKFAKKFKKKVCQFCDAKLFYIDYKQTEILQRFINAFGKIQPSRITGNCAKHQRKLALAIKRARYLALLPFIGDRIRGNYDKTRA